MIKFGLKLEGFARSKPIFTTSTFTSISTPSVQLAVPVDRFGAVATALSVGRDGLTIFAHASTGDDFADHGRNMIWFGPSKALNLAIFKHN